IRDRNVTGVQTCALPISPIAISPGQFRAAFDAARKGHAWLPDEVLRNAKRHRYVFIGGFNHEKMPGYFNQNIKELVAMGIPRSRSEERRVGKECRSGERA